MVTATSKDGGPETGTALKRFFLCSIPIKESEVPDPTESRVAQRLYPYLTGKKYMELALEPEGWDRLGSCLIMYTHVGM